MRYFAMIDGRRCGPYTLDELAAAGVSPDTYVWCKGMADWEKAEDVADICRYYRRRIFDLTHGGPSRPAMHHEENTEERGASVEEDPYAAVPARFRGIARKSGIPPENFMAEEPGPDASRPPMPTMLLSLFMTLFCFPITGLIAMYFSFKARKAWEESQRSVAEGSRNLYTPKEREQLRIEAHDLSRRAKMWIGISFFLGIIVSALVGARFF